MTIEKIIIDSVKLSKATQIPVLFMSNPGLGKTTILSRYAKNNGMHLETLIGSRFTPEEISGYMVNNGGPYLQHLAPEWYARIIKKKQENIPTLLFIDELSTCSEAVQGSLLSLIFDRAIGCEKPLPEDCIIVSAANYAQNLSSSMNILSPTLNRFAIINLNHGYSSLDLVEEFLSDSISEEAVSENSTDFQSEPLSEKQIAHFKSSFKDFWRDTFIKYSDPESAIGILDISNHDLENIYLDSEGSVYNFISGRTLSYLQRMLLAYIEQKINNKDLLYKLIDGLVGGGTYSFKDKNQQSRYQTFLHKEIEKVIRLKVKEKKSLPPLSNNVSKDIAAYLIGKENLDIFPSDEINHMINLVDEISNRFDIKKIATIKTPEEIVSFTSDFEALIELQNYSSLYPSNSNITNHLTKIGTDFYGLYCSIVGTELDFKKIFGIDSNLFSQICFLRSRSKNDSYKYERAALRTGSRFTKPSLYAIPRESILFEATLEQIIHPDSSFEILVFDNGIKFVDYDSFVTLMKTQGNSTQK